MTNNKTEKNELEARRAAWREAEVAWDVAWEVARVARLAARAARAAWVAARAAEAIEKAEMAAIADLVRARWPEPPDLGGER